MRDRDARPESPAPDAQLAPRDGAADDDEFERAAAVAGEAIDREAATTGRRDAWGINVMMGRGIDAHDPFSAARDGGGVGGKGRQQQQRPADRR